MALTVAQRLTLQKETQAFVAKILAKQMIIAAKNTIITADPPLPTDVTKKAKDLALENKFFKEKTKFSPKEDAARLTNELKSGGDRMKHNFDWLASYFEQLQPLLNSFTKRMIKFDVGGLNQSQVNQLTGVVQAVMRLAEMLDDAGATASDIVEFVQQMESTLKSMPSEDAKKAGLRSLFRW